MNNVTYGILTKSGNIMDGTHAKTYKSLGREKYIELEDGLDEDIWNIVSNALSEEVLYKITSAATH